MAENTVSALVPFDKGEQIHFIEENGNILFTAEEVGRHLGYGDPAHAIHKLYRSNQNELKLYAVETKTVSTDGKSYATRAFTEEGVYILSMLARTNKAKLFRAKVALLLRRVRQERQQRDIELARESGYRQGREEALALPATRDLMERIRLEGVEEGRKLQKRQDGYTMTMKAIGYLQKGLSLAEAAKLCDMTKSALDTRLRRLRSGMASVRRTKPVQGKLMEVAS